ncbi:MAG: allantoicase [Acidobacteriota bacterium]
MPDFLQLIDLASERLGGSAIAANDEFFAPRENLLKPGRPVFLDGELTDRGKWMDGWETRRRRTPGHDWCVVRLGLPGILHGFVVDTTHFKGNAPESCSIEACETASLSPEFWGSEPVSWTELVSRSPLRADTENFFPAAAPRPFTHVRLNIFPDGGVARLRVHGEVAPDWDRIARAGGELDLAGVENGGLVLAASDEFFGSRQSLIMPGRGRDMTDGWETRRRRDIGHDWAIVRLGRSGTIRRIDVDTMHFKGNAPRSCSLEVCRAPGAEMAELTEASREWNQMLPETPLFPHSLHRFEKELAAAGEATHARFNIYPDGGVSRLRLWAPAPAAPGGGAP